MGNRKLESDQPALVRRIAFGALSTRSDRSRNRRMWRAARQEGHQKAKVRLLPPPLTEDSTSAEFRVLATPTPDILSKHAGGHQHCCMKRPHGRSGGRLCQLVP